VDIEFADKLINIGGGIFKAIVYFKGKNAKKFRKDIEYGSAQWSA